MFQAWLIPFAIKYGNPMGIHPFNFLGGDKHNVLCDLCHSWRCFCFLDPYVHEHHVLRKCCWEFGKHNHYWLTHTSWCVFCSTIQWTIVLNVAKRKVQSYQNSNLSCESILSILIYELMCNEKLRTSSVVHPMLVKWLVIFDFAITKF